MSYTTESLIEALKKGAVEFNPVIQVIDSEYEFTPTRFVNGNQINEANTNNGSCKIFAFAKLNGLSEQAALNAFGDYYTVDVLQNPDKEDHQNIRNFITQGWNGIKFDGEALVKK
ncbi:MAG: HopJ type III effector protein [Pseudomonadota bacterium]|nr:HopJ type III effector protein [Pseudomonadota bacterium]